MIDVADGNDIDQLDAAFEEAKTVERKTHRTYRQYSKGVRLSRDGE